MSKEKKGFVASSSSYYFKIRTDKNLCRDVSVPRLAGFSLIT
jgi:hypothetical protein